MKAAVLKVEQRAYHAQQNEKGLWVHPNLGRCTLVAYENGVGTEVTPEDHPMDHGDSWAIECLCLTSYYDTTDVTMYEDTNELLLCPECARRGKEKVQETTRKGVCDNCGVLP